jgi:hypothetical protein
VWSTLAALHCLLAVLAALDLASLLSRAARSDAAFSLSDSRAPVLLTAQLGLPATIQDLFSAQGQASRPSPLAEPRGRPSLEHRAAARAVLAREQDGARRRARSRMPAWARPAPAGSGGRPARESCSAQGRAPVPETSLPLAWEPCDGRATRDGRAMPGAETGSLARPTGRVTGRPSHGHARRHAATGSLARPTGQAAATPGALPPCAATAVSLHYWPSNGTPWCV